MDTQEDRRRRRVPRTVTRLQQNSQHDQDENRMPEQDPELRRSIRSKYREIKHSIAEDSEEFGRLGSNRFHEIVQKMDDLSKQVHKPREQIADAEAVMNLSHKLLGSVKGCLLKTGISPRAFVTAIIAAFGKQTAADSEDVEVDWGRIGLAATGFLREAPGVCTMLGPMDIEPKVRQVNATRAKRVRPTETARAEEVRDQGEAAARSETDANMTIMYNILLDQHRAQKRTRLDALVLNKNSFSQTVENIFSLSFLVKDGKAAITFDSDGTHLVDGFSAHEDLQVVIPDMPVNAAPKNAPKAEARQSGRATNTQFVFRFDWNCWKVMQENYQGDILMPDRSNPEPTVDPVPQPSQKSLTPIRKNSRNRGRESRRINGSDNDSDEAEPKGDGRRHSKRARTLVDQFR